MSSILQGIQEQVAELPGVTMVTTRTRVYHDDSFDLESFEKLMKNNSDVLGPFDYSFYDNYIEFSCVTIAEAEQ